MIPDKTLNKMLATQLLGSPTLDNAPDNVFASFQTLAVYTKKWLLDNQMQQAKKCFDLVSSCYGKCSADAQRAIETAFMFSIACCLDGLPNSESIRESMPEPLRGLSNAHRFARDI